MKRVFITFLLLASAAVAGAQTTVSDPTPTPTPTPSDVKLPDDLKGVQQVAPNYRSDDRSLPELDRVGVDVTKEHPLTLSESIELALSNNKDIEITRRTSRSAEFDIKAAKGFWEPRFNSQVYYDHSTVPNTSVFSTNKTSTQGSFVANGALNGYVPQFGTVLTGSLNNSRVTSDNPINILSPQFNTSLNFGITQPLLRGLRFDAGRRNLEVAKRNYELSDIQFEQKTIDIVTSTERAYWDLVFALRNLQVQRDAVRDAKDQLEHNKRLVKEGQLAPIDVVAADTQVANYEQAVYDALNNVNIAENTLKNLISPNRGSEIWSEAIMPVESVAKEVPNPMLTDAIDLALKNRPELEVNKIQKDINGIDQKYYRELKKPQIDLVANYTTAGIGGSLNPNFQNPFSGFACSDPNAPECLALAVQQRQFLQYIGGSATAYTDMLKNRYPTFRIGVNIGIPLFGDKTDRALLGKSKIEAEKIDLQREQLEQSIQVDVRNSLQAVRTGEARLRAAAIARENSQKQYDSEQRKLDEGQSDIYKVLDRQTALTAAKSAELRARTDLNKAIADLQRATGNALAANNIQPTTKK